MRHPDRSLALPVLGVAAFLALAGCSGEGERPVPSATATAPSWAPDGPSSSPAPRPAPSTVPPLGPDLACMNPNRCYLQNPAKRTDPELVRYFRTVEGAGRPPAPDMRPWAYVVLGAADQRLVARSAPSPGAGEVTDEIGILNHRAVFAYCRQAADGGPVRPGTPPGEVWFRIEPLTTDAPPAVWMDGRYLVPYGHDGALPAC